MTSAHHSIGTARAGIGNRPRLARLSLALAATAIAVTGCSAVVESPIVPTTLPDAAPVALAVADAVIGQGQIIDATAAACIGQDVVETFGVKRLNELGVRPGGTVGGQELMSLAWTDDERTTLYAKITGCLSVPDVVADLMAITAPAGDEPGASCLTAAVLASGKKTNRLLRLALDGDSEGIVKLLSVDAQFCLRPETVEVVVPPALTQPIAQQVPGEDVGG